MRLIVEGVLFKVPSSHLAWELEQHFRLNMELLLQLILLEYFMYHKVHSLIIAIKHILVGKNIKSSLLKRIQSLFNKILSIILEIGYSQELPIDLKLRGHLDHGLGFSHAKLTIWHRFTKGVSSGSVSPWLNIGLFIVLGDHDGLGVTKALLVIVFEGVVDGLGGFLAHTR